MGTREASEQDWARTLVNLRERKDRKSEAELTCCLEYPLSPRAR